MMKESALIRVRVDRKTKDQARKVLKGLDTSMPEAICPFLRQVVLQKGLPFEVEIPNALTRETLEKAEQGIGLCTAASVDELFKELEA